MKKVFLLHENSLNYPNYSLIDIQLFSLHSLSTPPAPRVQFRFMLFYSFELFFIFNFFYSLLTLLLLLSAMLKRITHFKFIEKIFFSCSIHQRVSCCYDQKSFFDEKHKKKTMKTKKKNQKLWEYVRLMSLLFSSCSFALVIHFLYKIFFSTQFTDVDEDEEED